MINLQAGLSFVILKMKINLDNLDSEDLEVQKFEKCKSKKHKLKGKQSVKQLVSREEDHSDPDAKFENSDLNALFSR